MLELLKKHEHPSMCVCKTSSKYPEECGLCLFLAVEWLASIPPGRNKLGSCDPLSSRRVYTTSGDFVIDMSCIHPRLCKPLVISSCSYPSPAPTAMKKTSEKIYTSYFLVICDSHKFSCSFVRWIGIIYEQFVFSLLSLTENTLSLHHEVHSH